MIDWLISNWKVIVTVLTSIIGTASVIVKLTPTLKDDNILLPIVRFIGKFIALDKYAPTERPQ
jgi:hypothetical protein